VGAAEGTAPHTHTTRRDSASSRVRHHHCAGTATLWVSAAPVQLQVMNRAITLTPKLPAQACATHSGSNRPAPSRRSAFLAGLTLPSGGPGKTPLLLTWIPAQVARAREAQRDSRSRKLRLRFAERTILGPASRLAGGEPRVKGVRTGPRRRAVATNTNGGPPPRHCGSVRFLLTSARTCP